MSLTASTLAGLVAAIWNRAGYRTAVETRGGETYVIAEPSGDGHADLCWIVPAGDPPIDTSAIGAYRDVLDGLSVGTAFVVTDGEATPDARQTADEHGIVVIDGYNLLTLVEQSGVATVRRPDEAALDGPETPAAPAASGEPTAEAETDEPFPDADLSAGGSDDAPGNERVAADADESPAAARDGDDDPGDGPDTSSDDAAATGVGSTGSDDLDVGSGTGGPDDAFGGTTDDLLAPDEERGPSPEAPEEGGRSRRGVIKAAAATGIGLATVGLLDRLWLHVVFGAGGSGLPAYNETRVKTNATSVPLDSLEANADTLAADELPVTYEGTVTKATDDGGLVVLWVLVDDQDAIILARWDAERLPPGTEITLWGVFTGMRTVETEGESTAEYPALDVVDLVVDRRPGGGTATPTE